MFQFKFGAIHIRVVQMVFSGIHTDRTTEPVYFGKQKIWDLAWLIISFWIRRRAPFNYFTIYNRKLSDKDQ